MLRKLLVIVIAPIEVLAVTLVYACQGFKVGLSNVAEAWRTGWKWK